MRISHFSFPVYIQMMRHFSIMHSSTTVHLLLLMFGLRISSPTSRYSIWPKWLHKAVTFSTPRFLVLGVPQVVAIVDVVVYGSVFEKPLPLAGTRSQEIRKRIKATREHMFKFEVHLGRISN